MVSENGDVLCEVALRGLGIVSLPDVIVADDLTAGRLQRILPGFSARPLPLSALWTSRQLIPATVRVVADFLAKKLG